MVEVGGPRSGAPAVVVVTVDGRIVHWDAQAEHLIGHAAGEVIGTSMDVIIPEEHRAAHWRGFRRAMASPELRQLAADIPVLCADGAVRHLAGSLTVLVDGLGGAAGAVAVFRDDGSSGVRPFG